MMGDRVISMEIRYIRCINQILYNTNHGPAKDNNNITIVFKT